MLALQKRIKSLPISRTIFLVSAFLVGANWYNLYWPSFPWLTRYIQYVRTQKYKRATFAEKIAAIDFKVGKWKKPIELLKSKDFQAIYKHPTCYYTAAKAFLAHPFYTHNQKKIVTCALSYLPIPFCQDWLKACLELHKKGKINDLLLSIIQYYTALQSVDSTLDQSNAYYLPKPQEIELEQVMEDCLVAVKKLETISKQYKYFVSSGLIPLTELAELIDADYWTIYTHPDHYIEVLATYLVNYNKRNMDLSSEVKRFRLLNIMRSKRHLSPTGYAQLVAICWNNYKKGLISSMQLYSMVVCEDCEDNMLGAHKIHITHPYVVKYYKNPVLQRILVKIQRDPALPAAVRIALINLTSGFSKWHNRSNSEIIAIAGGRSFFFHEDLHGIYIPISR